MDLDLTRGFHCWWSQKKNGQAELFVARKIHSHGYSALVGWNFLRYFLLNRFGSFRMDVNLCLVNSKWSLSDKMTTHLLESNWYLSAYTPEQHRLWNPWGQKKVHKNGHRNPHSSPTKYHTLKPSNIKIVSLYQPFFQGRFCLTTAEHSDNLPKIFFCSKLIPPEKVLVIDLRFNDGYLPRCTVRTRTNTKLKSIIDTVDGRNPAPAGMYKTLKIIWETTNLNWSGFLPSTVSLGPGN